jgi:hypothetical protein
MLDQWNTERTLAEILHRLQAAFVTASAIDNQLWRIDGTTVRAALCPASGGKRRHAGASGPRVRSILEGTTKSHIFCDGNGLVLGYHVTAAPTHESSVLDELGILADQSLFD